MTPAGSNTAEEQGVSGDDKKTITCMNGNAAVSWMELAYYGPLWSEFET